MNKHSSSWPEGSTEHDATLGQLHPSHINEPHTAEDQSACSAQDAAEIIYRLRRKRERLFAGGLFSDPAWDILLDLYIAEKSRKEIFVTSACLAAGVPASTGLRWITILVQNGYVERRDDPNDARRSLVSLTDTARSALEQLFDQFTL